MPAKKRFSLALMMAIIGLIAIDIAALKASAYRRSWPFPALLVIVLPIANVMVLLMPRIRSRVGRRFWMGFEVGSGISILTCLYSDWNFRDQFIWPLKRLMDLNLFDRDSTETWAMVLITAFVLYIPPQICFARACGWVADRLARPRSDVSLPDNPGDSS